MTLEILSRAIRETYGYNTTDILSGKIGVSDLGLMLKSVIENMNNGVFYFPDALYDSYSTRKRRISKDSGENLKNGIQNLIDDVQDKSFTLYKYRAFIPQNETDNVWKPQTVTKAKALDLKMHGKHARYSTLERQKGRNGKLHIQGLVALPYSQYDPNIYQILEYSNIETGVRQWLTYLSKVKDCRLEREYGKLLGPLEHALNALGEWFTQSLRNRRNGVKRNPRTVWYV